MTHQQELEQRALKLTIFGNAGMVLLGLVFAVISSSEAILFDGVFSAIHLAISLLSLRVARLLYLPEDKEFPFGYAMFEPLLNLGKGLVIAIVAIFALFSSAESMLNGGRPIEAGVAIWYAIAASTGCLILAWQQYRYAQASHSPILDVDAKNWLIDGLISGAVAVAFGLILFLQHSSLESLVPYADPALVILLVLFVLPIPIQTVRDNWAQIMGQAPADSLRQQVNDIVGNVLQPLPHEDYHLRPLMTGRLIYVQVYVKVSEQQAKDYGVAHVDKMREQLYQQLQNAFPYLAMDLIVTCDRNWIHRATMPAD
ncbi:cation diffusion facilitator family transporter [Leptothoe spongobia]|uniref:Cation diffusion facilitator family transporter n=1 Tax=Leptothoe spongobia TAU-MAC 1115 TaxID=1967444 RepID=A0A947DGL5_9CYAN|nr:cation diffusion facilitator family transporter [Leptothoe spongobia]MBT9316380.1 cation diffusion facilitator family transporter [Leptothoe spongobia TAU-MAC 1115]